MRIVVIQYRIILQKLFNISNSTGNTHCGSTFGSFRAIVFDPEWNSIRTIPQTGSSLPIMILSPARLKSYTKFSIWLETPMEFWTIAWPAVSTISTISAYEEVILTLSSNGSTFRPDRGDVCWSVLFNSSNRPFRLSEYNNSFYCTKWRLAIFKCTL
jgi:hypothetical protein